MIEIEMFSFFFSFRVLFLAFSIFKKTLFLFRIKYKVHDPRKRRCCQ